MIPAKWGSESLVNTTALSSQSSPAVTALSDGRFVVAFRDNSKTTGDISGEAVRAQIFNADGSKSGAEFLVNATTLNSQNDPAITALSNGGFVVTFADYSEKGADLSGVAVRAQIFSADGTKLGTDFVVNTTTSGTQYTPDITALANGKFVVTFSDASETGDDTSGWAVRAQIFDANGIKSGSEFVVNSTTTGAQQGPGIQGLSDGRFVIVYTDTSQTAGDTSSSAIRMQIFDADGTTWGTELLVNTTTLNGQSQPEITELSDGRFVVTFVDGSETGGDTSGLALRAQIYNANGTKSGAEFQVNTTASDWQWYPSITALNDGRFVVAFLDSSSTGADSSGDAVRAQVFNADGTKSGAEFVVNTVTSGNQQFPSISTLADGRFVVTFVDRSQSADDNSGSAVRGQIFDPRETGIDIQGTGNADDFVGSKFNDKIKGKGGNDKIVGGNNNDKLWGDGGRDKLYGDNGKDTLKGGNGNDKLFGDKGKDKLYGGKDNDKLTGGAGKDIFVFAKKEGKDTITDFTNGKDKIDLSAFNFNNKAAALAKFYEIGSDTNDKLGFTYKGTEIIVKGIDMGDLNGADIII
jgi:Ca2+-binding RTX toxin-like protein